MGFLDMLFETRRMDAQERRNLSLTNYQAWIDAGLVSSSTSGVMVSPDSAMKYSAVYACVRILAETVASLPLNVYRRLERGKAKAPDHYLYNLLHDSPNDDMTSFEYRETVQAHLAQWGNAYSYITFDGSGRVTSLFPLLPGNMQQIIRDEQGRRWYHYQLPSGRLEWYPQDVIWHLRGLGRDGLLGHSPIALHRQSIGLGMATEEFGSRFFSGDARVSGILEHPGALGDEAYARLQLSWGEAHGGLSKAHKLAILEEGMKYNAIGIPPEDAQFLETRRFQVQDIARIYRIPPHMLADLERATFSNIEHQSIDFVVHAIRPWLVRWEQSIQKVLFLERERGQFFAEFLVDGLLRGDTKSRYEAYAQGRMNGWLSANDIREMENMNPVDGGDVYLIPLNMVPASAAGTQAQSEEPEPQDEGGLKTEASFTPPKEQRQRDVALQRQALMGEFLSLFQEGTGRIVRREVADIKRQARKMLPKDQLADFVLWLNRFYEGHQDFVVRNMHPIYTAYAPAVVRSVQAEVGNDADVQAGNFIDEYANLYALRYTEKQRQKLIEVMDRTEDEDILPVLEQHLDHWDEVRPEQESRREAHRALNAIAILAMASLGVTIKRWATVGDNCPWCNNLNGKTVEVHGYFLPRGGTVDVEGQQPMRVDINTGHPPLHDGCDCMVVAG